MSDLLPIALGVEKFEKIIQDNLYYVDKTSFIKQIASENVALFTRPRRFGKTLNMSMLKNFFEMNYDNPSDISKPQELFKDLAISKDTEFCKKHMGQYPVISLSLKDVEGSSFENAMISLCDKFLKVWNKFERIIINATNLPSKLKATLIGCSDTCLDISLGKNIPDFDKKVQSLRKFLSSLSEALSIICNKKAIVIVDEYDVPLEKSRGKYYRDMVDFIGKLFSETFKTNDNLEKGFLTGCLRVSRESIFTGFNNLQVYDCATTKYAELFGFTNDEVKQLLKDYNLSDKFDIFKEWYDGYQIGNSEIYNPYSVLTYVDALIENVNEEPVNAWINASSNNFLTEFINYLPDNELSDFKKLLDGGTVEKVLNMTLNYGDLENHDDVESLWTMLYVTGYLTKVSKVEDDIYTLKIPNKEVRKCFQDNIVKYFTKSPEYQNNGRLLVEQLVQGYDDDVSETLNDLLPKYLGLRDIKTDLEYTYHNFVLGLFASSGIKVKSQIEAGDGFPDIMFKYNNPITGELTGVILELKRASSDDAQTLTDKCEEAIKQCKDRKYFSTYLRRSDIKHIYIYGLAFCNRACAVSVEEIPKA